MQTKQTDLMTTARRSLGKAGHVRRSIGWRLRATIDRVGMTRPSILPLKAQFPNGSTRKGCFGGKSSFWRVFHRVLRPV